MNYKDYFIINDSNGRKAYAWTYDGIAYTMCRLSYFLKTDIINLKIYHVGTNAMDCWIKKSNNVYYEL